MDRSKPHTIRAHYASNFTHKSKAKTLEIVGCVIPLILLRACGVSPTGSCPRSKRPQTANSSSASLLAHMHRKQYSSCKTFIRLTPIQSIRRRHFSFSFLLRPSAAGFSPFLSLFAARSPACSAGVGPPKKTCAFGKIKNAVDVLSAVVGGDSRMHSAPTERNRTEQREHATQTRNI